jgi:hypothetical protein
MQLLLFAYISLKTVSYIKSYKAGDLEDEEYVLEYVLCDEYELLCDCALRPWSVSSRVYST